MSERYDDNYNIILNGIAEELDIPPGKYKEAVDRYMAVGEYLRSETRIGAYTETDIYPQGSFRLGTVVRPLRDAEEAEYDIDLVCEQKIIKSITSPQTIKSCIGELLKNNGRYSPLLQPEGRRCWTLEYAEQDKIGFHLDILPSIPEHVDLIKATLELNPKNPFTDSAIAITERDSNNHYSWKSSNSKGYARWFESRMQFRFKEMVELQKSIIFSENRALFGSIDDVPDQLVRTPLQRAIQLLKRHRDIMFKHNPTNKPISIIITTLAAWAYDNEPNLYDSITSILSKISDFIEVKDREIWIPNPVNPAENFADKWKINPILSGCFYAWLKSAQSDFKVLKQIDDSVKLKNHLKSCFGEYSVKNEIINPGRSHIMVSPISKDTFNVNHREKPEDRWPIRLIFKVSVTGEYKGNGTWHSFTSNPRPLEKYLNLHFRAETDVPRPFTVYWQVVNTGPEAESQNGLRGNIFVSSTAGVGGLNQKESTLYKGTHWIECFIIKDNSCLARSGEFIVNIQ